VARALGGPALLVAAAVVATVVACEGSGRREAGALSDRVDRYRKAEGAQREAARQALLGVACSVADVCAAKAACLGAVDPTTKAFALKDEVTARLSDLESGKLPRESPEADALPGKLDEAERLLHEGRAKMSDCDARLVALRARYGP
jgi:hypothetical protein